MSRSVHFFLLFVFVYTTSGIPLGDNPRKQSLRSTLIPSQWGKDSEISYHWPKGEVPYLFDDQSYDDGVKDRVRIAMAALERDSCIRFKERKGDGDGSWLHFTNPGKQRHCFHDPSYQSNGEIQVVLGYDCLRQRDILHSVLHGVGFRDEVSHPQRDLFVKIMWGNIQSAYKPMFRIQSVNNAGGLVEYDPMSIMHFHDRAYSLNGQATITPLLPGLKIAPSDKLSHLDKMKLRIMFGHECNKRKVGEVLNKCKGILTQYDQAELTTTKPEDNDPPNNEDVKGDANHKEDPNASGNNGDQKKKGDGFQETIVVGNDVNSNHEGDPNASDNNDENQKGNGNGFQETIVVGNDVNSNHEGDPNASDNNDENQKGNSNGFQETIVVGNDVNGNHEGDPNASDNNDENQKGNDDGLQETIVVGNDINSNHEGDPNASDNNDENQKGNDDGLQEIIVVGNDINSNHEGDPSASDNNNPSQKGNGDEEETIIVGNNAANGNTNNEDDVDDNRNEKAENVDSVEVNKNYDTIENVNNNNNDAKKPSEVIIVGNEHKGSVISDNGNGDIKGNKNKSGPEDLKGRIKYNRNVD